jgi:hypothetical protein
MCTVHPGLRREKFDRYDIHCPHDAQHLTYTYLQVRAVRDAMSSSDDETIQRFIVEVNRLRALFDEGINVQTWIVIRNVENNVAQLSSTLEEINDSG